jgi:hypothetical protein
MELFTKLDSTVWVSSATYRKNTALPKCGNRVLDYVIIVRHFKE